MADKPILFSAPMIRALLEGRKTMTRRLLKPQPPRWDHFGKDIMDWGLSGIYQDEMNSAPNKWWLDVQTDVDDNTHSEIDVKYAAGDRLWCREAWHAARSLNSVAPRDVPRDADIEYAATARSYSEIGLKGKLRPSMFMPRWASRLTLIVEAVKVERLHDISEVDAIAEGCIPDNANLNPNYIGPARSIFEQLWNSINGTGAWDANPWVVAVSFRVVKANIDHIGDAA